MLTLDNFNNKLPTKPWCTDNLSEGLIVRDKETALKKVYIQHNQPYIKNHIVLDLDYNYFNYGWDIVPLPNIEVRNRENQHSHIVFSLDQGVCTSSLAHLKPLKYLDYVKNGLTELFKADKNYAHLITKNPNCSFWETTELRQQLYSLDELAEYIKKPIKHVERALETGVGRNCDIFETVRHWAYKNFRDYGNVTLFEKACYGECAVINSQFKQPLDINEVKAISRSIAKYCFKYLPKSQQLYINQTHTAKIQSSRGKNKRGKTKVDLKQIEFEFSKGTDRNEICRKYKICMKTLRNYIKKIKPNEINKLLIL